MSLKSDIFTKKSRFSLIEKVINYYRVPCFKAYFTLEEVENLESECFLNIFSST